jgi:hypothetical protein
MLRLIERFFQFSTLEIVLHDHFIDEFGDAWQRGGMGRM